MQYIKDLKSLITLLLTLSLIGLTFMGMLEPKDAIVPITLMIFTYYFTKKDTIDSNTTNTTTTTQKNTDNVPSL